MTAQNAIDLAKLPAPNLLEELVFETIFAEMVAAVQIDFPTWQPFESEITTKILQIAAYRILTEVQARNEAAKQCLIAFATGTNLDNLGANLLVSRLEAETDEDFRARIVLSPESYSTAGPQSAYAYHAKSSHTGIADISVTSPAPKEVLIAVLGKDPPTPTQEILDLVNARCNAAEIRPLTDEVTVVAADLIDFTIEAELIIDEGPDSAIVQTAAEAALHMHLASIKKIGRDITRAGIISALYVPGVHNVILTAPAADIPISLTECGNCVEQSITIGDLNA